jgi:cytochrome c-type biogenesis protein CcmE
MTTAADALSEVLIARAARELPRYYVEADDVLTWPNAVRDGDLSVHGCVVDGSIESTPERHTFLMRSRLSTHPHQTGRVLRVAYEGFVPDTFRPGAEVVVRARLLDADRLEVAPDGIMAKVYQRLVLPPCPF